MIRGGPGEHLVPTLPAKDRTLALDQVAQGITQPGSEYYLVWGTHNLSGQPVPLSHYPLSKKKKSSEYLT